MRVIFDYYVPRTELEDVWDNPEELEAAAIEVARLGMMSDVTVVVE